MPADAAQLRLFVDESALGLGKVLAMARRDVVHTGHPLIPEVPLGALDPDWIPAWSDIEDALTLKGVGPWFVAVNDTNVVDLSV